MTSTKALGDLETIAINLLWWVRQQREEAAEPDHTIPPKPARQTTTVSPKPSGELAELQRERDQLLNLVLAIDDGVMVLKDMLNPIKRPSGGTAA